ncbi:hypothetical protein D3C80_805460 [compost metagenome]
MLHCQLCGQRLFFAVRAAVDQVNRTAGQHARCGVFSRGARFQHLHHLFTPGGSQLLIFHVGIYPLDQTLSTQFGQFAVEIFTRLTEVFVGSIPEAKDRKRGFVKLRRFLGEQEFMQRNRLFRRLTFPLGGGDDHQQTFLGNLLEFVVAGVNQRDAQLGGQQIVAQLFRQAASIAGLRGGNQRDAGGSGGRRRNGYRTRLLINHSPEIT